MSEVPFCHQQAASDEAPVDGKWHGRWIHGQPWVFTKTLRQQSLSIKLSLLDVTPNINTIIDNNSNKTGQAAHTFPIWKEKSKGSVVLKSDIISCTYILGTKISNNSQSEYEMVEIDKDAFKILLNLLWTIHKSSWILT